MQETASEIKWREDLKTITEVAERYGVCGFLLRVAFLELPIESNWSKPNGRTISHYVNGWIFEFEVGTGKFLNRY